MELGDDFFVFITTSDPFFMQVCDPIKILIIAATIHPAAVVFDI